MLSKSHYDCTRSNLCNRPSNNFCYDFEISSRGVSHDSELIQNFQKSYQNYEIFENCVNKNSTFRQFSGRLCSFYVLVVDFPLSHWLITTSSPLLSTITVYRWFMIIIFTPKWAIYEPDLFERKRTHFYLTPTTSYHFVIYVSHSEKLWIYF